MDFGRVKLNEMDRITFNTIFWKCLIVYPELEIKYLLFLLYQIRF
jgi:hypothetical protein